METKTAEQLEIQNMPTEHVIPQQLAIQTMQTEQVIQPGKEPRDCEMGPWNIPKYVAKKRKHPAGKVGRKSNDGNSI